METPLKIVRIAAGETQIGAAEKLGIDQGHYSRIERGAVCPAPELARRISTHFGGKVTPMEIMDPTFEERKAS